MPHVCALFRRLGLAALAVALASPTSVAAAGPQSPARAAESSPAPRPTHGTAPTIGRYTVRKGDSLERVAKRVLGRSSRWREIWRLNPDVENPDRIAPGTVLRVPADHAPLDGALLVGRANRVENRLGPFPWSDAERGDFLAWRDSLRTFTASSAELAFGDQTSLQVSEETLVFLDPAETRRAMRSNEPDRIEIVRGQADLRSSPSPEGRRDASGSVRDVSEASTGGYELVLGDTVASPSRDADGDLEARARKVDDGARVMVYAGSGEVASGGESVELTEGTGSAVTEGEPPGEPEELLAAPDIVKPAANARRATPRPSLAWQPVDGAATYIVEICHDADCGELVVRRADLDAARWRTEALEPGSYHWRVTARSASGLDGYPSETRALAITSDRDDVDPPTVAFRVDGPHLPPRFGVERRWILGPGARIEVDTDDVGSGVERWEARLDGDVVDPSEVETRFATGWSPGEHRLEAVVFDQAENQSSAERTLLYDTEAPRLRWGVEGDGEGEPVAPVALETEAVESGSSQQPSVATLDRRDPRGGSGRNLLRGLRRGLEWTVIRDPRQILLRPERELRVVVDAGDGGSEPVDLGPEQGLWILGVDDGTGFLERLEYEIDLPNRRGEALRLRLFAADAVGNATGARLELRPTGET